MAPKSSHHRAKNVDYDDDDDFYDEDEEEVGMSLFSLCINISDD